MADELPYVALLKPLRVVLQESAKDPTITDADKDAFLKEQTGGKYGWADAQQYLKTVKTGVTAGNLARSGIEGLTSNFADELAGGEQSPETLRNAKIGTDVVSPGMGDIVSGALKGIG